MRALVIKAVLVGLVIFTVMVLGLLLIPVVPVCQAQNHYVHSICVVELDSGLRLQVEQWLQAKGFEIVDCMASGDLRAADADLSVFGNALPIPTAEYFVYTQGTASRNSAVGSVVVVPNEIPPAGVRVVLLAGGIGGGAYDGMLMYNSSALTLERGLKGMLKALKKADEKADKAVQRR